MGGKNNNSKRSTTRSKGPAEQQTAAAAAAGDNDSDSDDDSTEVEEFQQLCNVSSSVGKLERVVDGLKEDSDSQKTVLNDILAKLQTLENKFQSQAAATAATSAAAKAFFYG